VKQKEEDDDDEEEEEDIVLEFRNEGEEHGLSHSMKVGA